MGKVIPLERPSERRRHTRPDDAPKLGDFRFEDGELEWLAERAGQIAYRRSFTDTDLRALIRAITLARATGTLVKVSDTDGDLAVAVERRRREILADLGL